MLTFFHMGIEILGEYFCDEIGSILLLDPIYLILYKHFWTSGWLYTASIGQYVKWMKSGQNFPQLPYIRIFKNRHNLTYWSRCLNEVQKASIFCNYSKLDKIGSKYYLGPMLNIKIFIRPQSNWDLLSFGHFPSEKVSSIMNRLVVYFLSLAL